MSKFSDYVLLGDLAKPLAGIVPSGVLATYEISNTAIDFISGGRTAIDYTWKDYVPSTTGSTTDAGRLDPAAALPYPAGRYPFNNQGQKWIRHIRPTYGGPQEYGGVCNCATPRRFSAPGAGLSNEIFPHIVEHMFLFTGTQFSVVVMNLGGNNTGGDFGGNVRMQVEVDGEMYNAAANPLVITRNDGKYSYLNVVFNKYQTNTKIRLTFGTAGFYAIRTDSRAILAPAPNRWMVPFDSDSYGESSQALCTNNVNQFFLGTIMEQMYQLTQWCIPALGQGATGWFSNGATQVFDDTVGTATNYIFLVGNVTTTGLSRYFSGTGAGVASRRGWYTSANTQIQTAPLSKPAFTQYSGELLGGPLGLRPLATLLLGTWNDRSSGVGNPVTYAQMHDRVAECWDWVHSIDPYVRIVHISPEPFDDGLFNHNTGVGQIGPPVKGDVMTKAQQAAADERDWVRYVNCYGPDPEHRWVTGMGPEVDGTRGVPTNSQQAQLVSPIDSIHPDAAGTRYYGSKIIDSIMDLPIPLARVNGLV